MSRDRTPDPYYPLYREGLVRRDTREYVNPAEAGYFYAGRRIVPREKGPPPPPIPQPNVGGGIGNFLPPAGAPLPPLPGANNVLANLPPPAFPGQRRRRYKTRALSSRNKKRTKKRRRRTRSRRR